MSDGSREENSRQTTEQAAATKMRLVAVTRDTILEIGLRATNVTAICKRGRTSRSSIKRHFGSFDNLLIDAFVLDMELFAEKFIQIAKRRVLDDSSPEAVASMIKGTIGDLWDLYMDRGSLVLIEAALASRHDADVRSRLQPHSQRFMWEVHMAWTETYRALGLDDATIIAALSVTGSLLRGLSLARVLMSDQEHASKVAEFWKRQLAATVVAMTANLMGGRKGRSLYKRIGSLLWDLRRDLPDESKRWLARQLIRLVDEPEADPPRLTHRSSTEPDR